MLLAGMSAGCIPEYYGDEHIEEGPQAASYVSLSLMSAPGVSTRNNPTGGENGDGQENGQDYENDISSAVAFFFQGDVDGGADVPVQAVAVFQFTAADATMGSGNVDRVYTSAPQQVGLENGTYNVLVVANPKGDWWSGKPTMTLGSVCDYIQTAAWSSSGSGYSDFVMTSAAVSAFTLESNTKENPATATVYLERMAARIDYQAEASYICTDPVYPDATVEIVGAGIVNNLSAGSYILKRVADDVSGTNMSYMGNETTDAGGVATNYVIDPWTSEKTAANNSFTVGGASGQPASALYGTWFPESSTDPNWWADYAKPGTPVSDGTMVWQRIGYTMENTTASAEAGTRYSTGVVFKAVFHPQGVANYMDGETFFALGTHLFASMEDMMTYVYGADFMTFDAKIEACATWDDVRNFAASLLDNDPSGYKAYLLKQAETQQDITSVKNSLKWGAYMLEICGYSSSLAGGVFDVTVDQNNVVTREALQPYGVRTYEDAMCYYTWWVRHCNDNDDTRKGVMEYAIVRNNIYKLTVRSIYSIGGDVPGDDENIFLDVYVNDWLLLDPETLPM